MIRRWRRRRELACREAVELMTAYLEGALDAGDRARLEGHLAECENCTEYLAQLRATIHALGRAPTPEVPAAMVDDLVALYRSWRDD